MKNNIYRNKVMGVNNNMWHEVQQEQILQIKQWGWDYRSFHCVIIIIRSLSHFHSADASYYFWGKMENDSM